MTLATNAYDPASQMTVREHMATMICAGLSGDENVSNLQAAEWGVETADYLIEFLNTKDPGEVAR